MRKEICQSSEEQVFKVCPMCKKTWTTRDIFLADRTLEYGGYQADLGILDQGLFYFNHEVEGCGTTIIIKAEYFLSLYSGARYTENMHLTEKCPGYCIEKSQRSRCHAQCKHAFAREVSHVIKNRLAK